MAGNNSKKIRQQAREWGVLEKRSLQGVSLKPSLVEGQLCSSIEVRQNHELHRLWADHYNAMNVSRVCSEMREGHVAVGRALAVPNLNTGIHPPVGRARVGRTSDHGLSWWCNVANGWCQQSSLSTRPVHPAFSSSNPTKQHTKASWKCRTVNTT